MSNHKSSPIVSSTSSPDINQDDYSDSNSDQGRNSLINLLSHPQDSPSDGEPSSKKAMLVSVDKQSDEYLRKRARNNLAVKKSRDRSKKRIMETQERVEQLTRDNDELNQKVALLSKELSVLRALFTNGGFTVPCNLQIVAQNSTSVPDSRQEVTESTQKCYQPSQPTSKHSSRQDSVPAPSTFTHTSVIRSPATSSRPCHGVILVTEPGKMNLDIQAGIQFKDGKE